MRVEDLPLRLVRNLTYSAYPYQSGQYDLLHLWSRFLCSLTLILSSSAPVYLCIFLFISPSSSILILRFALSLFFSLPFPPSLSLFLSDPRSSSLFISTFFFSCTIHALTLSRSLSVSVSVYFTPPLIFFFPFLYTISVFPSICQFFFISCFFSLALFFYLSFLPLSIYLWLSWTLSFCISLSISHSISAFPSIYLPIYLFLFISYFLCLHLYLSLSRSGSKILYQGHSYEQRREVLYRRDYKRVCVLLVQGVCSHHLYHLHPDFIIYHH